MELHELYSPKGATRGRKRRGRGRSSGHGKTSCRGHDGQNSRSGGGTRIGFEGGQMPLIRRVPKRGFNNIFAKPLTAINVAALNRFEDGTVVDTAKLLDSGVLSKCEHGVKILGNGTLTRKLTVNVDAFSKLAKEKIEAAGGKAEVISK